MKALRRLIAGIHIFVGIGALGGGLAALGNPAAPLGMSLDALKNGPFIDFFVPGLFLFLVIGLGNIVTAWVVLKKASYHGLASGVMGSIMVVWIVIQCWIMQSVIFLQALYFFIGAVQGFLALLLLYKEDEFPVDIARRWLETRGGRSRR
ncbi:MAG TPA: hypothetical protein VN445_07015 [Rectinemataceae bacterium]|nr:hypothetical protein [Rectinemataceae bacterium]